MGMADFYIRIDYSNLESSDIELLIQKFKSYEIIRILDEENSTSHLSIECKFDNFILSLIIVYDNLCRVAENIDLIETCGIKHEFSFSERNEFVNFVFSSNESKLISYCKQLGYLSIPSKGYYQKRNKLRKYYTKMD